MIASGTWIAAEPGMGTAERPQQVMGTARRSIDKASELSAEVVDWQGWATTRDVWRQLVERCPHASFVLSVEWVDAWLATFGQMLRPTLVLFSDRNAVVGA